MSNEQQSNENYIGINAFGAQVGVTVTGLDKPVRVVGRGIKRMFGISKQSINKLAKGVAERTQ